MEDKMIIKGKDLRPKNSSNNINNDNSKMNGQPTVQLFDFEPEKILVFDILGPMAHFKNIQTNSSSLSYYFPPPTVVMGIIAAILGYKKDSYYENFSPANIFLAVSVRGGIRKIIQVVNYSHDEGGYTQIPLEILIPLEQNNYEIAYRIYFSTRDTKIYKCLKELLEKDSFHYPVYLGISEFIASIKYVGEYTINKKNTLPSKELTISSTINGEELRNFDLTSIKSLFIEIMRKYFKKGRERGDIIKILYSPMTQKIKFKKPPATLYSVKMLSEDIYISRLV
ncbi:MAG: type I-B CRISPR-associated protein Cas5b [Promethearchaeota archaeon]